MAQPTNLRTTNPLSSPITITKADVSYSYKLDYGSRLRGLVVLPKEGSSNLAGGGRAGVEARELGTFVYE